MFVVSLQDRITGFCVEKQPLISRIAGILRGG